MSESGRTRELPKPMPERRYEVTKDALSNPPTWGYRCLACGQGCIGYIKERYAHDDALNHQSSHATPGNTDQETPDA